MSDPNTWAMVTITNETGGPVKGLRLNHRYSDDYYQSQEWPELAAGASGELKVGYWTGVGRTGADHWRVSFEADGRCWVSGGGLDLTLRKADAGKGVAIALRRDGDRMLMELRYSGGTEREVLLRGGALADNPRPAYVIAHRCNDSWAIERAIFRGANAVECDLKVKGGKIVVLHDIGKGDPLNRWLREAARVAARYGEAFALIVLDLKLAASMEPARAAPYIKRIRDAAREAFQSLERPMNIVFSISSYDRREALAEIVGDLRPNEGVSIDEGGDPEAVASHFAAAGVDNVWYGDGIFVGAWGAKAEGIHTRVTGAVSQRDAGKAIKKVYVWTLGDRDTMRDYLGNVQVDGIFVNVPWTQSWGANLTLRGLSEALDTVGEKQLRLARRSDPAFKAHAR